MTHNNLIIKIILPALIFLITLPSCGEKYHSQNGLQLTETQRHPTRRGHRIAVNTQSPVARYNNQTGIRSGVRNQEQTLGLNPSQQDQDTDLISIKDVSIQEYRLIGNQLVATLKLSVNNEEAEIDLAGIILEDGTADLLPIGGNTLVHGVALCVDKELCRQIVLDVYYRDIHGTLQRHQVQSITPLDEDENEDSQEVQEEVSPTPAREEPLPPSTPEKQQPVETPAPVDNSQQQDQPVVNVPPDIPEGNIEDPAGTFVTRPPSDLEVIRSLPIPTRPIILQQQQYTMAIRLKIQQGETIEAIKKTPPPPVSEPTPTNPATPEIVPETQPVTPSDKQEDDSPKEELLTPTVTVSERYEIDPRVEIRQAMDVPSGRFLDSYVAQFGNYNNAVQEQAINRRSHGVLKQAELLIRDIHGVKWLASGNSDIKWVTSLTNHFLKTVGPQFQRKHPNHFIIVNRSSNQYGGYLHGHKTHQNGLDIDIAYPNADPTMQRFWSVYNGKRQFIMTEKDAELTMDLLKIMSATNVINKYHVDQSVKDYLTVVAQTKNKLKTYCPVLTQLCHAKGHHNHIHVQLKCTEFNRGCQDSVNPPYSTCPAPQACQSINSN